MKLKKVDSKIKYNIKVSLQSKLKIFVKFTNLNLKY